MGLFDMESVVIHKLYKLIRERKKMLEKIFKLSENKTTVKTEIMAGLTTFMTMA